MRTERTRHITLTRDEVLSILILAALAAFLLTFRLWGGASFNAVTGLSNLLFVFVGMAVAVYLHEGGHKLVASLEGYTVRIVRFSAGLVVSAFIGIYSQGYVPLFTPNLIELDAHPERRMHKHYSYDTPKSGAKVAIGGLAGTTLAIILFKSLYVLTGYHLFMVVVMGAFLHGMFSLVPFELINLIKLRYFQDVVPNSPGDGLHILWWSVAAWIFCLAFMFFFGMIALLSGTFSYVLSLLLAVAALWAMHLWSSTSR